MAAWLQVASFPGSCIGYPGNEAKSSLESSFHETVKTCMAEGSGQSVKSEFSYRSA